MTYILLIIATFFLMWLNGKLLDIPGFFYYSCVRPILGIFYKKKLSMVEDVYFWEIVASVGTMAHLSLIPAYILSFNLVKFEPEWIHFLLFFILNYLWWIIYSYRQVNEYLSRTPALRPRVSVQQKGT